jgi:hypothetical protein
MYRVFIVIVGLLSSAKSMAHAGHDHNDLTSSFIHFMWIAPLVVGAILLVRHYTKTVRNTGRK